MSPEEESDKRSTQAENEVERHKRQTLAGSYLERALAELRASGSSDTLYSPTRVGTGRGSRPLRGAIGKRIAEGRRLEAARSAVLFAMLAAEAYANQYLQIHLTGAEADAADRLPTFEKFIMGPQLVRGSKILDRGAEPAQTLKKLLDQRSALVHPKLAPAGSNGPSYTPEEAAHFIVAVADAAGWLLANSDPRPNFDMTMATVDQDREYFLSYGRTATERLPEIDDDPAPDLVITIWSRRMDERREG